MASPRVPAAMVAGAGGGAIVAAALGSRRSAGRRFRLATAFTAGEWPQAGGGFGAARRRSNGAFPTPRMLRPSRDRFPRRFAVRPTAQAVPASDFVHD